MKTLFAALLFVVSLTAAAAPAPDDVVRQFYDVVVADHPLGIPEGNTRRALWRLMTPRMKKMLDAASACEKDYLRKRGDSDEKPEYWWLESGLFSGPNEMASPVKFEIVSTETLPDQRSRVTVRFTYEETFETYGRAPNPAAAFQWRGAMLVSCDAAKCLVDEFIPFDIDGAPQPPLSESFTECKGGRWIGDAPKPR